MNPRAKLYERKPHRDHLNTYGCCLFAKTKPERKVRDTAERERERRSQQSIEYKVRLSLLPISHIVRQHTHPSYFQTVSAFYILRNAVVVLLLLLSLILSACYIHSCFNTHSFNVSQCKCALSFYVRDMNTSSFFFIFFG